MLAHPIQQLNPPHQLSHPSVQQHPLPLPPPQPHPQPPPQTNGKQPLSKSPITVVGIPSVSIQSNRLVVGNSQSSSARSYTPVKVLGDGSFGTVWLCDWHGKFPPGTPLSPMQCGAGARPDWAGMRLVAVKRMKKKWEGGWDECQKLKELESLRTIPFHPNIIPLYDFFLLPDSKELYFVFESMEGNLYHLIKARKGRPLAGGLVSWIFQQIVAGLDHIHFHGYFHRDMKPENVLVTTTGLHDYNTLSPLAAPNAPKEKDVVAIIKLADFGLARETKSSPPYTEYVSTRWYRAPEVLLLSRDYSNPVDMWALGTIMAELVNLRPLFPGSDQPDQVARICEILGDPSDAYGVDSTGSIVGGGSWPKGERLAQSLGFQFPKLQPKNFEALFDKNVPRSLISCIRDLLRYDPNKRLTSRQCLEHPYLLETVPRNNITLPPSLFAPAPQRSIPPSTSHVNGSQSNPSLVPPTHLSHPQHSQSAQSLHHSHQFPEASSTHRTPYPIPPQPYPGHPPPPPSLPAHHDYRQHPPHANGVDSQADYRMGSPTDNRPQVNGHPTDAPDSAMVQDLPQSTPEVRSVQPASTSGSKVGKLGLPFGKKPGKWGLGMFSGDKSHHQPLPPVDEASPAVVFTSRKRSQSSGSESKPVQDILPAQEPVDPKKNKKEAQRLHREAELEKRKLLEKNAREQARAVTHKRQQILRKNVGHDPEWGDRPKELAEVTGKHPSSGPVRPHNGPGASSTWGAAGGKFAMQADPTLSPDRLDYREWRGPPAAKSRRREYDDDHSTMSSSDVHSISRMSNISFATVDSDPGPSRMRHRPSMYGISRMTSRSSLRTSFDDFPPSARSSNSFSLEGQLAHDFRAQASLTGSISPPPLQSLSLSPTLSPSLSPSPPWVHVQSHKDDMFSKTRSPPFLSMSPRFHDPSESSGPHSPLDLNGQLPPPSPYGSSCGYASSSGHTPKSSKSLRSLGNHGFSMPPVPPPPLPTSNSAATDPDSKLALPPFSELDAVAGAGEPPPPLSPMIFTTPEDDP